MGNPNPMMRVSTIPRETGRTTLPETMLVEVIARLPLKSIARFKSVCKTLKSVIESAYFRSLFVSLHRKYSLSSWSLMLDPGYSNSITEVIGFTKCETWGLPKSIVSYIVPFRSCPNLSTKDCFWAGSSNGLIWLSLYRGYTEDMLSNYISFVGNPALQQWVEIPRYPDLTRHPYRPIGLVTRVQNGVVSSFKVIRALYNGTERDRGMYVWRVCVFSSETGSWTFKRLLSSSPVSYFGDYITPVNIDGMLYMWKLDEDPTEPKVLVAYDFYAPDTDDDQCRVIPLPVPYHEDVKRCLTTSRGYVICIEILHRSLKIWRLNNGLDLEKGWWELLTPEINMASVGNCFPMAMNPFDSDIVYLWNQQHSCLVSGNLRTQEFIVHQDSESWTSDEGCCRINTSGFKYHMEYHMKRRNDNVTRIIMLPQLVLPRWMDSVPRPPN